MEVQQRMYRWLRAQRSNSGGSFGNQTHSLEAEAMDKRRVAVFDATNTTALRRQAAAKRARDEGCFLLVRALMFLGFVYCDVI
jgi:hypothetical protein